MKQSRYKSKLMWAAVAAQVISLCQLTGVFSKLGLDAGTVGDVAAGVLQILTFVGVLNDPKSRDSF